MGQRKALWIFGRAGIRRHRYAVRVILSVSILALVAAGSAWAFQALPPGVQVNDAPGVNGDEPTNADVVGGALTAGKPGVPWAIFRQTTTGNDQVFVRSFAAGVWTPRGTGTVGGRSDSSRPFPGSLNFDQTTDGEAPAIDFAGAGRTVPWATWYETTSGAGFGKNNIFASRFDNTGDVNQGKWIFGGQGRGLGGGSVPVPSLNMHTDQDAENPSVAGGSAVDPTKPGPWATWQETGANAPGTGKDQIFTVKPVGPGTANCDGIKPLGVNDLSGHVPAVGGFCWQQVGVERLGGDPSMNVDRTRDGVEPDIAFTGANDSVPWVVWYEKNTSGDSLHNNEMVFAAKGVPPSATTPPTGTVDGGFNWIAVGRTGQGVLDNTALTGGPCAVNADSETACSLNSNGIADAEDPRVAGGTMTQRSPTAPWVAWDEDVSGVKQVFVSRLVGGATGHFVIANNGAPISVGANNSTRPDITFSGNTPYVTWREDTGSGTNTAFVGHFVNAVNPTFVLDESDVPLTPAGTGPVPADVREPISSSCIATPFNADGAACQGGAIGTPFFLFTSGTSTRNLFADAYQPGVPVTDAATGVSASAATVSGTVNPAGATVNASFQFGTTTAYGLATAAQATGPSNAAVAFSAVLSGLPAGTTIHYRAVVVSDFGTFTGADETLRTAAAPPPPPPPTGNAHVGGARVSGTTASVLVSCKGAAGVTCKFALKLKVTETLRGHKVIAITARKTRKPRKTHKVLVVGSVSVTLKAGKSRVVHIGLNRTGRLLLAGHHVIKVKLFVTQALPKRHTKTLSTQTLTFKAPHKHKRR